MIPHMKQAARDIKLSRQLTNGGLRSTSVTSEVDEQLQSHPSYCPSYPSYWSTPEQMDGRGLCKVKEALQAGACAYGNSP